MRGHFYSIKRLVKITLRDSLIIISFNTQKCDFSTMIVYTKTAIRNSDETA